MSNKRKQSNIEKNTIRRSSTRERVSTKIVDNISVNFKAKQIIRLRLTQYCLYRLITNIINLIYFEKKENKILTTKSLILAQDER